MTSVDAFLARLAAGERLFLPGSSAEPRPLVEALAAAAPDLPAIEITHNFLPGMNPVLLAAADNALREVAFFPRSGNTAPAAIQLLPMTYYGACRHVAAQAFDWVVVHVAPPDDRGMCSLGVSAEFTPAALQGARHVVGVVNTAMPAIAGAPSVPLDQFDLTLEVDWPLVGYDPGPADETSNRIARNLTALIDDGAALQVGIGRVPAALLKRMTGARDLRLQGGRLNGGFRVLSEAGALSTTEMHLGCTALGDRDFYTWLAQHDDFALRGVEYTHDPGRLAGRANFIAINSALEVDLLGQANLETAGGRTVSGIGGAPDFARGARCSAGGKSVVALPATARGGEVSRIVAAFPANQPVSLGRQDIDYVVTEYGIATLVEKTPAQRAEALIEVAAPQFREALGGATQP